TITATSAQQVALDNALVPLEKRVEICKCNMTTDPAKNVPEIYMRQCWFTINKEDSTTYRIKIDKKCYRIDMEVFREIIQICPRLLNQDFNEIFLEKKLSPSLRNLATKETLNLSMKWITNHQMQDSTAYKTYLAYAIEEKEPELAKKVVPSKRPAAKKQFAGVRLRDTLGNSGDEDADDQQSDDERKESNYEQTKIDNPKTSDDEEETQDVEFVHTPKDYVPTDDETNC
nr:hypothetical protein [Tanacetum cinerariifolium]